MQKKLPQHSIVVLGLGRSGEAAARLLSTFKDKQITVLDDCADPTVPKQMQTVQDLRHLGIEVITGGDALTLEPNRYELAVISPGIDPAVPMVQNLITHGVPLISEIELASYFFDCPIVAITGTNGKTTTTGLVESALQHAGIKTIAAGNIGKPLTEVAYELETHPIDILTAELSSFQLEQIQTFHPHVSVWLNFTADHLDRYPDMGSYKQAKLRIFENQTELDWAIVPFGEDLPPLKAKQITFSAYKKGGDFHYEDGVIFFRNLPVLNQSADTNLRGRHNAENLMAALAVGVALGLEPAKLLPGIATYKSLAHRFELVRQLNQVDYINDSKATNLDALEKALLAVAKPHSAILIAGGKDKKFPYSTLKEQVGETVRWAILIGEMAEQIKAEWQSAVPCDCAADLKEAVQIAWSMAEPGDTVLLAPGTSSYDMFQDYADRGNQFRTLVNQLNA